MRPTSRVYVSYTASLTVSGSALESRISRFEIDGRRAESGERIDPADDRAALHEPQGRQHRLRPRTTCCTRDSGTAAAAAIRENRSQNRSVLFGKMLRIDVSGGGAYTVPAGNPFASGGARCQTGRPSGGAACCGDLRLRTSQPVAMELRQGLTHTGPVGRRCGAERVGRSRSRASRRQLRLAPARGRALLQPLDELRDVRGRRAADRSRGGVLALARQFDHRRLCVSRARRFPRWSGATCSAISVRAAIFALLPDADGALKVTQILSTGATISSFGQGNDGELYYVNYGAARFTSWCRALRLPTPSRRSSPQTGCMSAANPTQPAAGLIPYTPVAQFWSDGATQVALDGAARQHEDHRRSRWRLDVPHRHGAGEELHAERRSSSKRACSCGTPIRGNWGGYTYRWNAAHTDATLVSGGLTETIGTQDWTYPSEAQCLQCHTSGAGRSTGLETRQLNSSITYPATGRSGESAHHATGHRDVREHARRCRTRIRTRRIPRRARRTARVRICTRTARSAIGPNGGTPVNLDLRYATAIDATNACNAAPASGDLGVADARIIAPGDASKSVLYLRMNRRDANQMPPVASHVVDTNGAALGQQWINGNGASCQ